MKKFVVIALCILGCLYTRGQSLEPENKVLAVERAGKNHKIIHIFKPGKKISIETSNGFGLSTTEYSLLENALVLSHIDTVYFSQITRIKGRVYVKKGRRAAGVLISLISIPAAGLGGFITEWSSLETPVAGALPFAGTFFLGIKMIIGKNNFDTSDKWTLVLSTKAGQSDHIRPNLAQTLNKHPFQ